MIRNLAYQGFTSPTAAEWEGFAPEILGAEVAAGDVDAAVRVRIDDQAWRLAIHPGETDDLAYVGWDVGDGHDLAGLADRLRETGIDVHEGDADLADTRPADVVGWFVDPFGIRHELVDGLRRGPAFSPGRELAGRFVTGEQGLGHIVLFVPDLESGHRFFHEVLGLVVSDDIESGPMHVRFYHCAGHAARHHTVALTAIPGRVGLHHVMLEVSEIDDVGRALDLVKERGIPVQMDLGRHPNDLMTSFYMRSPSGFDIEYGTGGVVVDDATWETTTYAVPSIWGHRPPASGPLRPAILREAVEERA